MGMQAERPTEERLPRMEDLRRGRLYKLNCRNLHFGVYDGEGGFIGIREKFRERYLFTEYHWDKDARHGTVNVALDTGVDVPEGVEIVDNLMEEQATGRRLIEDVALRDTNENGLVRRAWMYADTGTPCAADWWWTTNKPLLQWMEARELELKDKFE